MQNYLESSNMMDSAGALTQNDTSIELQRHIRQNNDRLRCIQKHLQNPQGFQQAAKELLEWCSDARAFQKAFEESLMGCLTVISEVASKPGFDLSLGYRLLAICAAHKHKFSVKSSNLLQCWSNDLGNLLLIQQQKLRPNEDGKQGPSPVPHMGGGMGNNYQHPPLGQQRYPSQNWNNGPRGMAPNPGNVMPPRPQQSAVSVITTVWGLSNTQQSQQMTQNAMSGNSHYQTHNMGHMGGGNPNRHHNDEAGYQHPMNNFNGPHHNKINSFGPKNDSYTRQDSYGGNTGMSHKPMNAMPYGPNKGIPGHHMSQDAGDYAQPAAAAAAAAVAAAAATATATATATLIANDQQQQQNDMNSYDTMMNQNSSGQYGMQPGPPNDMHRPLHAVHSGGGPHGMGGMDMRNNYNQQMPMSRGHPRPNIPPDYNHSRPPLGGPNPGMNRNGAYSGMPQQQFRGPFRHRQGNYPQYSSSPNGMDFKSPNGGPQGTVYSPRTPMGTSTGPMHPGGSEMYPNSSSAPPGSFFPSNHPQPNNNPQNQNFNRPPFPTGQYQSYRGNPNQQSGITSPINTGNVPPYPGPDIKPMMPPNQLDIKPNLPLCNEPPMVGGNMNDVKPNPGQLQRALMKENDDLRLTFPVRDGIVLHPFRLEHNLPHSAHMFQLKPKVYETLRWRPDLELQFKCYHHENRLSTTNWPHSVQVSVNDTMLSIPRTPVNRPLYLKDVCKEGKNIINIGVQTCCCSHLFVLQLVHRPTVQSVIKGLLQKRLLPVQHCITKIRRLFHNGMVGGMASPLNGNMMTDGNNSIKISLLCPITLRRIELPARGHDCKHIQCFDLSSYLQVNCDKGSWTCPVCKKNALLEGLEVDQYTWTILKHMQDGSGHEVSIDANCTWRPVHIKQEVMVKEEPDAPPSKRFKSGMSPSTMLNHLPSPGSYVPMMTPLPPNKRQPSIDAGGFPGNGGGSFSGCGMSGPHGASAMMQNRAHQPINKTLSLSELNDNIAANDKRQIERRINPAMSANNMINSPIMRNPNTPHPHTPGTPMRPPSHPSGQMSHNTTSSSHSSMQGNPNTPNSNMSVKPPTPGVGMSPSITNKRTDCNDSSINNLLQQPTSKSNNNLTFDADLVINGEGICDNSDVIPSLDILPENTDPMEILNFLEPPDDSGVPTTSADDLLDNLLSN